MSLRHVVVLDADLLTILISLADAECDSLHDLANSTEGSHEEDERQAHLDYVVRAEEAQDAISKALEALSHVRLLEEARALLSTDASTNPYHGARCQGLVRSIDRFLTGLRPEKPDPA